MSIEITYLNLGLAATNAYLVADNDTKNAVLIDPVDEGDLLVETAKERGWTIKLILATHAHFDHVLASARVKELTNAPFWIHHDAQAGLDNLPQAGMRFVGKPYPKAAVPDRLLTSESETLDLDSIRLKTLYTPGHAAGHLSFYMPAQGIVFSGDALFAGSIGRTDLPDGSLEVLMHSIFDKLMPLNDTIQVLPGHGEPTTIGKERLSNPFLLEWQHNHDQP